MTNTENFTGAEASEENRARGGGGTPYKSGVDKNTNGAESDNRSTTGGEDPELSKTPEDPHKQANTVFKNVIGNVIKGEDMYDDELFFEEEDKEEKKNEGPGQYKEQLRVEKMRRTPSKHSLNPHALQSAALVTAVTKVHRGENDDNCFNYEVDGGAASQQHGQT
jgi:hypothetical protein